MKKVHSKGNCKINLRKGCSPAAPSAQKMRGGEQLTIDNLQWKTKISGQALTENCHATLMASFDRVCQ